MKRIALIALLALTAPAHAGQSSWEFLQQELYGDQFLVPAGDLIAIDVPYRTDAFFGLHSPTKCPDVPNAILNPRDTWRNEDEYDAAAEKLAGLFKQNYEKYA